MGDVLGGKHQGAGVDEEIVPGRINRDFIDGLPG
jgi:hypothetical protein